MFSLVEDGLPDSVLRRKALKLEKVGVHLTGIKIIAECVLCICLMYAILHAGYWVKFLLPCVTTLSVTFISFLFDFYQVWAFVTGRTGCTIFLDNIDPKVLCWVLRKGYAVFYVVDALCYFGWVSVGIILATTIHGKDLQKSSNHPPIVAWVIATVSAFVASLITWLFIFVVHFERTFLSIHLKRFEFASAHQDVPIELQQLSSQNVPGPSEQGQDFQGSDYAEEDQSTRSGIDDITPLPPKNPATSFNHSSSRSATQAHSTDLSVQPAPITAEGSSASIPPQYRSDHHLSDQDTLEQGPSRQEPVTFGLSIAWKDRPSTTAPVYVKHTGIWEQVRKQEEEGE